MRRAGRKSCEWERSDGQLSKNGGAGAGVDRGVGTEWRTGYIKCSLQPMFSVQFSLTYHLNTIECVVVKLVDSISK